MVSVSQGWGHGARLGTRRGGGRTRDDPPLVAVSPRQKQAASERQQIEAECRELRRFLEEKEQLLLGRLQELEQQVATSRERELARLGRDIARLQRLLAPGTGGTGSGSDSGDGSTEGDAQVGHGEQGTKLRLRASALGRAGVRGFGEFGEF